MPQCPEINTNKKQKESYSGKKKAHTRKNILITDINRWIMMPKKKPRGKELTSEEKAQNKVISPISLENSTVPI